MAVTNTFQGSALDLNGLVSLAQPTALVWRADGRLYVTEVDGDVKVLSVAFGDKPGDGTAEAKFYVTAAVTLSAVKGVIGNHNDNGTANAGQNRQVTGIDVTRQFDAEGNPMTLPGGKPMVTIHVTSSDSRIGAGGGGNDVNLDTNSGVITKLVQTGPESWTAVDIVRGLPRSEENHATNGIEVVQVIDPETGKLVSERMIVAQGGNANTGAPSNNFAGQQEQPLSAAILQVDLDMLKGMPVLSDNGRAYVYDLPTLNDPSRTDAGAGDAGDPFGGNDGRNSAKLTEGGPVSIYSPGYRNSYDVEVSEDGRVWTYDNGANNSWGGRPIGEAGDNGGAVDFAQALGYIATNLNNGEGNTVDPINLVNWNPSNKDAFHEVTRSDDLAGRQLSAGQGGATTYTGGDGLTYVYGGHPNPTRAEGSMAGLLFTPGSGANDAYLLVSDTDSAGNGGGSDYAEVVAWLAQVEAANPKNGIYGVNAGDLTKKVLALTPGVLYDLYKFADGSGAAVPAGSAAPVGGTLLGSAGLPADIAEIVAFTNKVEGNYLEAGKTDGALDSGNGSINGLTEYTSTILDSGGVKMSGAIIAANLNGGNLIVMGRNADGTMSSSVSGGFAVASDRTVIDAGGSPLGLASLGDDYLERGLTQAFQGSIWSAVYGQNGPLIEVFQPSTGVVPLAGQELVNPTDRDLDGVDNVSDPFEFSATNGFALAPGETLVFDFDPQRTSYPTSLSSTGLLGAALDGATPNRDAQTAFENFPIDQQLDGLYDIGGNVLPGGNAPILQIKKVVAGTAVGSANTARDALHTGVRPSADVDRIVATLSAKNWIPEADGVAPGQLTGMMFGDGTQANFLRFVFGSVDGQPGFEVGYEVGDANYTTLAAVAVPGLADIAVTTLELRLVISTQTFAVTAAYRLGGQAEFTTLDLGGFTLPAGVLRNVLNGTHTIGEGAAQQASGAAFGFLAETSEGNDLLAVDFYDLSIEAFGNEIAATSAAGVGAPGSAGIDTVTYTGTDTVLAPLAANVENFDGSGSAAGYAVTGNALDNVIRTGAGANTITTGSGQDVVRGTLAQLAGDTLTDFDESDTILLEGATLSELTVDYASGSAVLLLNGQPVTFTGARFADFAPADGASTFSLVQTAAGVEVRLVQAETVLYRVNAGSSGAGVAGQGTIAALDGGPDWLGDAALINATGPISLTGAVTNVYSQALTDQQAEVEAGNVDLGTVPWQLFVNERSDNANDATKLTYNFEVEAGKAYKITLYYTENWNGIFGYAASNGGATRQFDVTVDGQLLPGFTDINPMQEAVQKLGQPLPTAAQTALHQQFLGVAFERTVTYTATDNLLSLQFEHDTENPKVNGIQISVLGGPAQQPADTTAPIIESIVVANPQSVQDGPRFATVVLSDETGFDAADFAGLDGSELSFTGIVPATVSPPGVVLSNGGKTATLTYTLTAQGDAWPSGLGGVSIAPGAYGDAAGNATVAKSAAFVLQPNLADLVRGEVALAINVGSTNAAAPVLGGAINDDPLILDAYGLPVDLQADNEAYYSPGTKTANNHDGGAGNANQNPALDGSAYHTYRDASVASWTATYPIANGVYVVELHFAELFHGSAGQRVGDFTLNGEVLALNFDAFAAAGGGDAPTKLTRTVTVTDGKIVVGVNADAGQPGFSAIVVYDAVPADLPPTVSVGDVQAVEGGEAEIVFTRAGDTSEAVTVTFALTPGSASGADYEAPATGSVVIPAGQASVSVTVPIVDDLIEEGAESFTVSITGVSGSAVVGDGQATVTIAPSDAALQVPPGGVILLLDFETPGEPLDEGGFDGLLGGAAALEAPKATVQDGRLVVQTSNGDLSEDGTAGGPNSKNDFTKGVDLSDPDLTQIYITSRLANPFTPEVLQANGVTGANVPNFAQVGIVFGTGTQAANEFVKLVFGGVAGSGTAATGVQMWSKGAVNQAVTLTAMLQAGKGLFDIAEIELSLAIDKAAGTAGQIVTFYDASGAIIGGVRPVATPGFATFAPVAMPAAVLANLVSAAALTQVGVTSTDFSSTGADVVGSFEASWEFLRVSSPQFDPTPTPEAVTLSIADASSVVENGDTDPTVLSFALTASDPAFSGQVEVTYAVDGTAGLTQLVTFTNGAAVLSVAVPSDAVANGNETVAVTLSAAANGGANSFLIDAAAASAMGVVTEDDAAALPVGPGSGQDLDGDGTANAADGDIDGDGLPNTTDLFSYDAANGVTLQPGQSILLDFEAAGTPFEAGFTGVIGTAAAANNAGSVETGTAAVANGKLNIAANKGDHNNNANSQADAYALGIKNPGGFVLETAFAMPDFNPVTAGAQAPVSFQTAGLAVSLSEDQLVKWVFGANNANAFQLVHEYRVGAATGQTTVQNLLGLPGGVTYASIQTVKLTLEMVVDAVTGVVSAKAAAVLGLVGGGEAQASTTIAIPNTSPLAIALKDAGVGVSAGLIQTSFGTSAPAFFDVGYEYFKVSSTAAAPDAPPTVDAGLASQTATEDAPFLFAVPADAFADDGGATALELTATLADGSPLPTWLSFANGQFSGTPENGDVGEISVRVLASDGVNPPAAALFTLAVQNVNDAPTIAGAPVAQTVTLGQAASIDLSGIIVADPDLGDAAVLKARLADGSPLPDGVALVGGALQVAGILPQGDYDILLYAEDGSQAESATTVALSLTVAPPALPRVSVANAPTVQEGGDAGEVLLLFPLTLSDAGDGSLTLSYLVNGVAGTATVTFAGGVASLAIAVPNDAVDNGPDAFEIVLTGVTEAGYAVDPTPASGSVTEDDAVDPADIDGDGILNVDDPFAYDASNGLSKVLTTGGSFRQDFDTDTTNPFDPASGFTGIIVNPAFNPPGASAADPYGDRTTEATNRIEGGFLKIGSSETDLFSTGTGANNAIKDNFISGADVSGVEKFSVSAKAINPFQGSAPVQYASFGITLGAGGTDQYVKFVLGGDPGGPRIQLAQEGSLTGGGEENITLASAGVTPASVAAVVFRLDVDKSGPTPTLQGFATLLDAGGAVLAEIATTIRTVTGSLAASLNGANPLTGGTGGIAYGVSITDWSNAGAFTGGWDYLELSSPGLPNESPTVTQIDAGTVSEAGTPIAIDLLAGAADPDGGTLGVADVVVTDGAGNPVVFALEGSLLTVAPGQFAAVLGTGGSVAVTVSYTVTDGQGGSAANTATLVVEGLDGPFTWFRDADGDGFGVDDAATNLGAYQQPEGYAEQAGDADDAEAAIFPGAPEVNDGLDNDQDGETDENNTAPVAGTDTAEVAQGGTLIIPVAELLANDIDAEGDLLTVTSVGNAVNGQVTLDAESGTVTFTPNPGYSGAAFFTYEVSDGFGGAATGSMVVSVTPTPNLAPSVSLVNVLSSLSEAADVSSAVKVADIVVSDDGLGSNVLTLSGADAGLFEIVGSALFLRAGAVLDFETRPQLDVVVEVDDATVGTTPDATASLSLAVTDGPEPRTDLISFGLVQLAPGVTPATSPSEVTASEVGGTVGLANRAVVALAGDGDGLLEAGESAHILGSVAAKLAVGELGALNGAADPVTITAHGRTDLAAFGALSLEAAVAFAPEWGFGVRNAVEGSGRTMSRGESLTWTLNPSEDTPQRLTSASFTVDTAGLAGPVEVAVDFDGNVVNTGAYGVNQAAANANAALRLLVSNGSVVAIDFDARTVAVNGAVQSGAAIEAFFAAYDASPRNALTIGNIGAPYFSVKELVLGRTDAPNLPVNAAPSVSLVNVLSSLSEAADVSSAVKVADIVVSDDGLGSNVLTLSGADAGLFEIVGSALFLRAGAVLDFETRPQLDVVVEVDDATVGTTPDATASLSLAVTDAVEGGLDPFSPEGDLDGDGTANALDDDLDGDGIANAADTFYYDSAADGHGMTLAAGEVLRLDFDMPGTPFQNGFTGVMPGTTAVAGYQKDTGAGVVVDGKLVVTTTAGDTGTTNNPQNDYQLGIRNGSFVLEGVFDNPYFGTAETPTNFEQLGLQLSLNSDAFMKLVFGSPGAGLEFSQDSGPQIKLAYPGGYTATGFAKARLELAVTTTGGISTGTAVLTLLDAAGNVLPNGTLAVGTLTVGATLAAALQNPAVAVGVGVTSTHTGGDEFVWSADYFQVREPSPPVGGNTAPTLSGPSVVSVAENSTEVASFGAFDADGDPLTFGLEGADAALFAISAGGVLTFLAAPDFEAPADAGGNNTYDVTVTVSDGTATTSAPVAVTVTDMDETAPGGGFGPGDDLDGDALPNSGDPDIDGDGVANGADVFFYDAANGQALADGQTLRLGFDAAGMPFENGFTGVMQGTSTAAGYQKETGAGFVAGGQLVVPTTSGDTGPTNNPQNAYHFGIKRDGGFTVETVLENPFGPTAKASFKQLGLAISLDSTDFVKFVAGNVGGDFEFSYRNNDAETKAVGTLPGGYTLFGSTAGTVVEKLKLVVEVTIDANGDAKAFATATLLDAAGVPLAGVAPVVLPMLDLVGDLEAALADPTKAVGVGVTHTNGASAQFEARYDYLEVRADGVAVGGPSAISLSNATVAENDPGAVIGTVSVSEPDGDAVSLAVSDSRFEIASGELRLKAGQSLDFEAASAISVSVTATDKDGSLTEEFVIGVANDPADDPSTDVLAILSGAGGVTTTDSYAPGVVGSAVLSILVGNENIQTSNFGAGSFQLLNTGDKKISAVFIDVRGALYPDSVFDDDGSGGDDVAKDFSFGGGSDSSALSPAGYTHFHLPARTGFDPLFAADKQDSGKGADGGWRGLLLKFGENGGGFLKGESANFSGDMDPNSIAGLKKSTVDSGDQPNWDVGGVSGAELIGSRVTIMFSDGTFAEGQLFSDGSQAGAQALISQAIDLDTAPKATLTVNGVSEGGVGSYGGTVPSVIVSAPVGATIRVVMTKGFDPVGNATAVGGTTVDQLVADRLDAYTFKANNAAEFQTVDVVIPASGSVDVGGRFAYNNAPNGNSGVPDFTKLQLGFTAAVVSPTSKLPVGAVSDPIYLANSGQAVSGGAVTPPVGGGPIQGTEGYFAAQGSGNNIFFKAQFEDPNVAGQNPGGQWTFLSAPDATGNQTGFQGAGYYLWGSETSLGVSNPQANSFLPFTFLVPEGAGGDYTLRLRVSRDAGAPAGEKNDVWVKMDSDSEALLLNKTDAVSANGFVKLFGGNTGGFSYANQIDSVSDAQPNFTAVFSLGAGLHTLTFAGRSQGFHLDFWELYKGTAPALGAANSGFVATGPTAPVVADPVDDAFILAAAGGVIAIPAGTFTDLDGDTLVLTGSIPPALQGFVTFDATTQAFTVAPNAPQGVYALSVSASDNDGNVATDVFNVTVGEQPVGPTLSFQVVGTGGFVDSLLETGDSYAAASLGTGPRFSGVFTSGSAASVKIELLNAQGSVVGSVIENVTPYDFIYSGPALATGSYTLKATAFTGTGATGQSTAVQQFGFSVSGGTPVDPPPPTGTGVSVGASANDWEQFGAGASADLELGLNGTSSQYVALRFAGLDIPADKTIAEAYFLFTAIEGNAASASFSIEIENSETSATYTTANNPGTRSYLPTQAEWAGVEAWTAGGTYRSTDISDLIAAVIGADGLTTGGALGFRITGEGSRVAHAFDSDGVGPRLVIVYDDTIL